MKKKAKILTYPTKILLDIFIVVVVLGIVELVIRNVYTKELKAWEAPVPMQHQGNLLLQGNPYLIFEYAPGSRIENGIEIKINSLGLRGDGIKIPKPSGKRRLLTIGDSAVFGFGVSEEFVFSAVAAEKLGENIEAINGAIPGYSTYQSINLLRLRAWKTEPDLLVIGSLWSDNNFGTFVDKEIIATMAGFEESLMAKLHRFLSNSAMYRVADWRNRVSKQAAKVKKVGQDLNTGSQSGYRRVAINDYAKNLEILVRSAQDHNAEVLFLLLANEEDIKSKAQSFAWSSYRQVMRDTASRHGIPLLDGITLFKDTGLQSSELFIDKMHPSVKGHRILGEELTKLLKGWSTGKKIAGVGDGKEMPVYSDRFQEKAVKKVIPTEKSPSQENKAPTKAIVKKTNSPEKKSKSVTKRIDHSKSIPLAPPLEAELSEIDQKANEAIIAGKTPEQPFRVVIGLGLISIHFSAIDRRLAQEIRDDTNDLLYRTVLMHIISRRSKSQAEQVLLELLELKEFRATSAYLLGRIGSPGYPGKIRNPAAVLSALQKYLDTKDTFTDPWNKKTIQVSDYVLAACIRIAGNDPSANIGFSLPDFSSSQRKKLRKQCLKFVPLK